MIDKKDKISTAVKTFKTSKQSTEDYMHLMMIISEVTRQGSGLVWGEIYDVIEPIINETSEWQIAFPNYNVYIASIDSELESYCGLGHEHLPDYNWMDAYLDEIPPKKITKEFMHKQFPIY